jgi:hypothetical protein
MKAKLHYGGYLSEEKCSEIRDSDIVTIDSWVSILQGSLREPSFEICYLCLQKYPLERFG